METQQLRDRCRGDASAKYTADLLDSDADATMPDNAKLQPVDCAHEPLSWRQILLLNLSFFGLNLMFLVLSVEVVPAQVEAMVGSSSKGSVLGGMVAAGAVLTFLIGPGIGMASDRIVTRIGRRRPVMMIAAAVLSVGLVGMALTSPVVRFKRHESNNTNGSASIDSWGMCNIDLVAVRCSPYSSDFMMNNSASISHNSSAATRFLKNFHPKRLAVKSHQVTFGVDDSQLGGSIGLFSLFYFIVTGAYVSCITPYNALIADITHPSQRGLISGVMGGMILFGNIAGAAVGLFLNSLGIIGTYLVVMSLMLACIVITVATATEPAVKDVHEPLQIRQIIAGFWLPLKEHDFRWVFITRFLMQQGLSTTVGFLEYWLTDMVPLPQCWNPARGTSLLLLPLLTAAAISSLICGKISDSTGQRKPLIRFASVAMGICTLALAALRGKVAYFITLCVAVVFGSALGSYQAVDFALVMDVLSHDADISRDIAVWQQALVLPQAIAIPIGGVILDLFERVNCRIGLGYIMLFITNSVYFVLGGLYVNKIRNAT